MKMPKLFIQLPLSFENEPSKVGGAEIDTKFSDLELDFGKINYESTKYCKDTNLRHLF